MDRRKFLKQAGSALAAGSLGGCAGTKKIATPGVPRSSFTEDATAEEVTAGLELDGRLALVTGCTSGIGFETMRVLALRGARVIGTSRSLERARAACQKVAGLASGAALDLGDLDSVVACAEVVGSVGQPLDMLILNAGYFGGAGKVQLIDGIEKHFFINHLGNFLLTNCLLESLHGAPRARVVSVSSRAAYKRAPAEGIQFDNLDGHRDYDDFKFYGHSKLANALFALQLSALLSKSSVTANALHPGVINTEIDRNMSRFMQSAFAFASSLGFGKTIAQGAATTCYVATNPALESVSGAFFEDCNAVTVVDEGHIHNRDMAEKLWRVSVELTREYLPEPLLSAGVA